MNLVYGLKLIRLGGCFRENNRVFRASDGCTLIRDIRKFETRGYVRTIDISRAVTITEKGEKFLKDYRPSPNALAAARQFIRDHDEFWIDGEKLRSGGDSISMHMGSRMIEEGKLVLRPNGRYTKPVTMVEVMPDELPWIREMLRCLRST